VTEYPVPDSNQIIALVHLGGHKVPEHLHDALPGGIGVLDEIDVFMVEEVFVFKQPGNRFGVVGGCLKFGWWR